ncbi:MAG: PilZ domain-containing protein [candidate division Zixibacteria bacterium]|nr:PilZ domain-containing protein [candidate division Zixibacteria bacterium]MDH3937449.1 PilZ domain-containing protein [candidate division Zixibacteria bacterium]MDH4034408.1 PilZ domain-containing protein [candidate division Zixibacteria bacterium]
MNDKRRQKRHETSDLLKVLDRDSGQPVANLANLSTEGAMFVSHGPVKVGRLFKCKLDLPQPIMDQTKIEFDAECRWCKQDVVQNRHESGYSLTNVSDTDKEIISYLILRCVIDEWSQSDTQPRTRTEESVDR